MKFINNFKKWQQKLFFASYFNDIEKKVKKLAFKQIANFTKLVNFKTQKLTSLFTIFHKM